MATQDIAELSEDELFARVVEERAAGQSADRALGLLIQRWKRPALYVISRVQASYGRRSDDDAEEIFQDSVAKLVDKGLDQFRGISEQVPGKAASPRTFFLRIAKHVAIDRYRRSREVLAEKTDEGELTEGEQMEARRAVEEARRTGERSDATELYWQAFRRLQQEHPNEAGAWELYHHEDVEDHAEVARRLQISVVNSYKRVSRAQAYLKVYLLELEEESR
jgi:RNA polymerase sigma-70 factor, ECF subfamily